MVGCVAITVAMSRVRDGLPNGSLPDDTTTRMGQQLP